MRKNIEQHQKEGDTFFVGNYGLKIDYKRKAGSANDNNSN